MLLGLMKFKMWYENLKFIGIKKKFCGCKNNSEEFREMLKQEKFSLLTSD